MPPTTELGRKRRLTPPSPPPLPECVEEWHQARQAFVSFLEQTAGLLCKQARHMEQAKVNLDVEAGKLLSEIIRCGLELSCDAVDHPLVSEKPFGYYDEYVMETCNYLKQVCRVLAIKIGYGDKAAWCVHFILRNMREDFGF